MADKEQNSDGSAPVNNPLSRKLNKILESRLDSDKDVLEALKSLSGFFLENNLRSRRNLRGDIERRSLTINEEFVQCFQNVKEQLDSLYEDVQGMNECCEDMTTRLKSAKEQTHDLISQTTKLQTESQRLEMRCKLADAFLTKFQLKSEEVKILRGTRGGSLHPDFFTVLSRVKQIHADCKILLRTNQQRAGLEIMESMALHQESAYERLYRWAQNECRLLTSDSPDVGHQLCQAMEALQDRPVLFRYALDEFGTARRTAIARGFIDALTRGAGPGRTPRPIELHSHDPLRYVGDMLAWLHQAMASEKEHIYALVKQCKPNALNDQVQSVLSHISEGVCRNFKTRLEQVLVAQPGTVLLYKLANLLKFYHGTIGQILEGGGLLINTVEEMQVLSLSMFFTSLNTHATKLLDKVELPPADLGVTTSLNQTLQLLKDILASHDASMVPLDSRKQDFQKILSCMVEPLIQMCSMSASRLNTVDMATYMVNCIYSVQVTLSLYEFTDQRLEMLRAQIDAHIDTLVSEQASFILARAGLAQVYSTIQQYQPKQGPLSNIPGMDPLSIKDCMKKFDSYLASPDNLVMSQCSKLLSGKLRETVKRRSIELICEAFKQMYTALTNVDNGYPEPMSLVPRTPEQVQKLLL